MADAVCVSVKGGEVESSAGLTQQALFNLSRLWCEQWRESSELAVNWDLNRTFNLFDMCNVLMNGDGTLVFGDRQKD